MKNRLSPISEIVQTVFARLESEKKISKEAIEDLWRGLVGEAGFKHSRPTALRKKILAVKVDNSAWLQELTMRKRRLLKGLKRTLGKDRISEINFKIGEY